MREGGKVRRFCLREDNCGDVVVAELVISEVRRAKETVGKPSSSSDGNGGQQPLAGNVTDRADGGNVGVLVLVDDDVASGGCLDTDFSQAKVLGVGLTANCPQENVGFDGLARVCVNGQFSVLTLLNLCDLGFAM